MKPGTREAPDPSRSRSTTTHSSSLSVNRSVGGNGSVPGVVGNGFGEDPSYIRVIGRNAHLKPQSSRVRAAIAMGSDEDPKEYDRLRQLFKRTLIGAEVVGITMCLLIIFWTTTYAGGIFGLGSGDKRVINLHVVLMLVFMLYLHGHAALMYRIFPTQPKYTIKLLHGIIHLSVCIGIGCGFAAAIEQHNVNNVRHFYSLHSWMGLTAIVFYYIQFLAGFFVFLLPYAPMSLRTTILPYHRFTGQILFSLATGSAITGVMLKATGTIKEDYPNLPNTAIVLNATGFLALTFSVIIGNLLSDERFRRRPRPEGELLLADTAAGRGGDTSSE